MKALLVALSVVGWPALGFAENQEPMIPPPGQSAMSLSLAIKTLEGKSVEVGRSDVVLLDDGTAVEIFGPSTKHDAYIFFGHVGCKEAVPMMIKALAEYEKAASAHEVMICTSLHLQKALVAQTGEDFGYSVAAWQKWWDAKGKNMPDWFFESNVLKRKGAKPVLHPEPPSGRGAT